VTNGDSDEASLDAGEDGGAQARWPADRLPCHASMQRRLGQEPVEETGQRKKESVLRGESKECAGWFLSFLLFLFSKYTY
jgi:hypothetical protein